MVLLATGLACGIVFGRYTRGTYAVIAMCLFLVMLAASIPLNRRAMTVFLTGAALGFARMLPHIADATGPLAEGSVYALANAHIVLPEGVTRVAEAIYTRCDALFLEASPLVRAIVLGDTSKLSYFDNEAFRAAGVSHILALSGLNASILAALIALVIPKRRPGLRFLVVAAFLLVYCLLTAFPASLVRACTMSLCMLAAPVLKRKNDPLSSLALAFALIVLPLPFSLFSAGFQLSFAATAGILMLYQPLRARLTKLPSPLAADAALTLSATLATLPFTLAIFGRLPLYSLIANLVVVPLVTLSLPLAIAALIADCLFHPLGAALAFAVRLLAGAADYLSKAYASIPYSVLRFEKPSALACALFLAALVFLSKYCLLKSGKKYAIASSLVALSTLSLLLL
ncbi:MAG TPA: ComEC/Rec2 family competence protein [Clostridia bacterium]|nr:ComEC/Rec2 family competence protein [Clostridia bacterium]